MTTTELSPGNWLTCPRCKQEVAVPAGWPDEKVTAWLAEECSVTIFTPPGTIRRAIEAEAGGKGD